MNTWPDGKKRALTQDIHRIVRLNDITFDSEDARVKQFLEAGNEN